MITYKSLRDKVQSLEKFPECEKRARAPLIHEGFPGTFNLSFTEYDYKSEFGDLSSFNKNLIFSTVQSCIRAQDIDENIRNGKDLWKYLGVFEMADLSGQVVLSEQHQADKYHLEQIKRLVDTLTGLGLKKEKIFPSYNIGGNVEEITQGKYTFDFQIPQDVISQEGFLKEGIPKANLIADKTRDTLLSLHINEKTPWGYRNEILYNIGTKEDPKLLDIGTIEKFVWFPKYLGEEKAININGLVAIPHTISLCALGLERLCTAVNGLSEISEVDYIRKFYDVFRQKVPHLADEQRFKAGEVIRALHRIYSDCVSYGIKLTHQRSKKIRKFLQIIKDNTEDTLHAENLARLLITNTEAQPWHGNLQVGIEATQERILKYLESRRS